MADVLFIVIMVAFFGLAVLLVRACDVIIGPDEDVVVTPGDAPGSSPAGNSPDGVETGKVAA